MSAAVDVRRLAATAIAAAVTSSCLAAPGLPEATGVLGVSPERLIAPEEPVEVLFSAPVLGPTARWTVVDEDGAPVPAQVVAEGASWRLQPATVWPAGEVLRIEVDGDLVDEDGAPVAWPADGLLFEVAPARLPMTATIRWPTPGMPAPAGVRWIAVDGIADDRASIWLVADDHRFEARRQGTVAGLTRFALDAGPCEGLCPDATYALALSTAPADEEEPDAGDDVRAGIRGRVVTATAVDHRSPRFEVAEVEVLPGWIEVRWSCDEPGRVVARLSGPGVDIEADIGLGRTGVWRAEPAFEAGQVYDFAVWAADLSERRSDGPERRIVGPAPVHVVLRELVTTPRSDWGDSEPRGVPFDASPGGGTVSSADEWLELVNASEGPIDIEAAGVRVLTIDRTPAETLVISAPALRFGDGGDVSEWRPGEGLVVRPRGDMTQADLTVEVWAGALLLDRVVLGDGPGADHPGGGPPDLIREALARSPDGRWRWCRPTPGDPRPNPECSPPR